MNSGALLSVLKLRSSLQDGLLLFPSIGEIKCTDFKKKRKKKDRRPGVQLDARIETNVQLRRQCR